MGGRRHGRGGRELFYLPWLIGGEPRYFVLVEWALAGLAWRRRRLVLWSLLRSVLYPLSGELLLATGIALGNALRCTVPYCNHGHPAATGIAVHAIAASMHRCFLAGLPGRLYCHRAIDSVLNIRHIDH